ncbi:type III-B CRISPR module RAMP protein Cmr1 [Thermotoga profunda]|uniref:type III-B CRISPR module RAMP protein Cmr1 n=1 Tax=Thermotoga profunda TaxID=1508420 RepID=UPI000597B505|nr:type III-B CRISPR module RAMP protein Cmr1 [Thermotoga profunda]
MNEYVVKIKALTRIWTGDAKGENNTLKETGIIGSLRWWYEALVRGLGGYACDPTSGDRCSLDQMKFKEALKKGKSEQEALNEQICLVCQFFGCTGWSKKFVLRILDKDGKIKLSPIESDEELIFKFIPLKEVSNEEWALLNSTLHFIAEYGAIGGKTVLKPSDESGRENAPHHLDFGLIEIIESKLSTSSKENLEKYVKSFPRNRTDQENPKWVSIKNFWCVKGKYLARQCCSISTYNNVLGRKEPKIQANQLSNQNDAISKWLAGSQKESKKIFSFKTSPRTFGFINPDRGIDFETIRDRLKNVWGKENGWKLLKGEEALDEMYRGDQNDT